MLEAWADMFSTLFYIASYDFLLCFACNKRRFVAYVFFATRAYILRNAATIF
jgi:hypothetical protein